MVEGFTIKCNKCGRETTFTANMEPDNHNIDIVNIGYDGEIGLHCECGNEVEEGE